MIRFSSLFRGGALISLAGVLRTVTAVVSFSCGETGAGSIDGSPTTGPDPGQEQVEHFAKAALNTLASEGTPIDGRIWSDPELFRRYMVAVYSAAGSAPPAQDPEMRRNGPSGGYQDNVRYCGRGQDCLTCPPVSSCLNHACYVHDRCYARCSEPVIWQCLFTLHWNRGGLRACSASTDRAGPHGGGASARAGSYSTTRRAPGGCPTRSTAIEAGMATLLRGGRPARSGLRVPAQAPAFPGKVCRPIPVVVPGLDDPRKRAKL